jgi:hypothetical protein
VGFAADLGKTFGILDELDFSVHGKTASDSVEFTLENIKNDL